MNWQLIETEGETPRLVAAIPDEFEVTLTPPTDRPLPVIKIGDEIDCPIVGIRKIQSIDITATANLFGTYTEFKLLLVSPEAFEQKKTEAIEFIANLGFGDPG
jgi:hypothetical protein